MQECEQKAKIYSESLRRRYFDLDSDDDQDRHVNKDYDDDDDASDDQPSNLTKSK